MVKRLLRVLILFAALAAAFIYGYFFHRNRIFPYQALHSAYHMARSLSPSKSKKQKLPPGLWFPAKDTKNLNPEQIEEMEKLASIGYVSGDTTAANSKLGVTVYKKDLAFDGYNCFTSGNGPEAIFMDMDGRVLHRWKFPFESFWPEHPPLPKDYSYWRRVHLYPNGDILAIYEGNGLVKLNKDSQMLWGFRQPVHHALDVLPDGTIYVLTRHPKILSDLNPKHPILEDFITVLDANGKELKSLSVVRAFQNSVFHPILSRTNRTGDIFHTNAIKVLDGSLESKSPIFKKGNLLISCAHTDTIAIIDPDQAKVVWAITGMWKEQHEPILLPDGNLMVYDNQGSGKGSRIIEIDPITQQVRWIYEAEDFNSYSVGSEQRLPNGNTLITQSWDGRVFEVTDDKQIVWEFHNPYRAGDRKEYVAVIPEMLRIPRDFPLDWLPKK